MNYPVIQDSCIHYGTHKKHERFFVEEAPEMGYTARALGECIEAEAGNIQQLHAAVRDAVQCYFDNSKLRIIRLYILRDQVIAF